MRNENVNKLFNQNILIFKKYEINGCFLHTQVEISDYLILLS
jgi:hypothetical protein